MNFVITRNEKNKLVKLHQQLQKDAEKNPAISRQTGKHTS